MRQPTVAVTGATGFIGSQVVRRLANSDFRVHGARRPDSTCWHVEDIDCRWSTMELEDPESVRQFVAGATGVIHCAGYHPRRALQIERAKRQGVAQLRTLLDACRREGVKRIVYVSCATPRVSGREDGGDEDQVVDETSRFVPGMSDNAFFETKAAMEAEVYRYIASGLDIVTATPTMVCGPGDIKLRSAPLIRAIVDEKLPAFPAAATINIVDPRDVAQGIVAALEKGRSGRRYLLAGHNVDIQQWFESIAAAAGSVPARRVISMTNVEWLARLGERLVECVGSSRAPALSIPVQRAAKLGPVSNERASGELGFQCRAVDTTARDLLDWMGRVGFISWSSTGASTPPVG